MQRRKIKAGCCGFPFKRNEYFKNFSVVEVQSTFYQPPVRMSTVERWRREAPEEVEFIVKAWQLITHPSSSPTYRRLRKEIPEDKKKNYGFFKPTEEVFEAWERIKKIAGILGTKIVLFQCPGSFKETDENIENLKTFFREIEKDNLLLAWEQRGGWRTELIENLCRQLDIIHCVDPFKQRPAWGQINYFRLHGKPGYNLKYRYTNEDLEKLKQMCDKDENYCLFNNLSMAQDARKFKRII